MTTTLRPAGPLQHADDGATSRTYDVCVNSRRVGVIEVATDPAFGPATGEIRSLRIDEPDRRRGRGTVAVLAAEEVLRDWRCRQVLASAPPGATAALRMLNSLGYTERSSNMTKELPPKPPALPAGVESRPVSESEYPDWLAGAVDRYARSAIDRGTPPEEAHARSARVHGRLLPDGPATPGVTVRVLVHEGAVVGHVWVAHRGDEQGSYVYDVLVAEGRRGEGFGRALMLLAERLSLEAGSGYLALHVFADNTPAVRLYESLQYRVTGRNFIKQLL
ncbi:acetyltransferase [Streptomyces sp. 150FB]|uniref:GNAT family N-acetyltransferase n=1 Tax=Streptomyces sp. 150FB TaxID=1576605 RepID=UPI0005891406|nr:GNAT family N-acetyltransferase [Streptomyces sp. 150FB]KIF73571.1 acetyltransferase [Streptomyces sp. 150FB]